MPSTAAPAPAPRDPWDNWGLPLTVNEDDAASSPAAPPVERPAIDPPWLSFAKDQVKALEKP